MIWVCRDSQVTSGVPPAPTLSLSPEFRVFVRGEQLHFKCSLPGGVRARRFLFYKEAADGQWEQIREQSGNTLEVSTEHLRPREEFGCSYQEENGTEFQSAQSNVVVLSVTDPPPSPVFSVTPKQDVYTSGESVDLTCSAPDKHKHRTSRILYFKNGGQLHLSNPPPSLVTLRLSPQDAGNYYCSYQVLESGREVLSLESNSTFVSVMTESLLLPLAIGCGGGGALVLLVLLACLYKRKPKALQGENESSPPVGCNSGILPQSKIQDSKVGDPSKEEGDKGADSGAEFEFPEITPTYTLLGSTSSTSFHVKNGSSTKEEHIYSEISL
ncbi:uncharacterized protein LOC128331902 isoform X3 [Hemicordylus capensis]|uniref:uncharacterized protein LOC128331902 isoform X3 n=1 Tax=Hemicordylus capensis TaxID=884348 RepID=UPI002302C26D|nr:uncharacterized protein LOC128331902 isoform X3 [Hemicordylus capensis]